MTNLAGIPTVKYPHVTAEKELDFLQVWKKAFYQGCLQDMIKKKSSGNHDDMI